MNRVLKVTRLQLNKLDISFIVPLIILLLVFVISAIIALAVQRTGADPMDPAYADGARSNQAMFWALPGFLIYLGVQAVSTTFPFALALGATRRAFVAGTALAYLAQALYVAIVMVVLLGLELATDHWFFGLYVLDTYIVGAGDPLRLFVSAFIGTFVALSIGGVFGSVWVRFGAKGPTVLGLVLGLGGALTLLVLAPQLGELISAVTLTGVAVIAVAVAILSLAGMWGCMRRTAVR